MEKDPSIECMCGQSYSIQDVILRCCGNDLKNISDQIFCEIYFIWHPTNKKWTSKILFFCGGKLHSKRHVGNLTNSENISEFPLPEKVRDTACLLMRNPAFVKVMGNLLPTAFAWTIESTEKWSLNESATQCLRGHKILFEKMFA